MTLPFTSLTGVAAPIDGMNVDTDQIIPARFLRYSIDAPDYKRFLFHDFRFYEDGSERPEFILNRPPYRNCKILVTAENFGCGSSREAAIWALLANNIRALVGPSFGEIFSGNAAKNGVLAAVVSSSFAAELRHQLYDNANKDMSIDLHRQVLTDVGGRTHPFDIDPFQKHMLLSGQDEINLTLSYEAEIAAFEGRHAGMMPWLPVHRSLEPGGRR